MGSALLCKAWRVRFSTQALSAWGGGLRSFLACGLGCKASHLKAAGCRGAGLACWDGNDVSIDSMKPG